MHARARTTPLSRLEIVALVQGGESISSVARRFCISRPTVYKWVDRFVAGDLDLHDRSSVAKSFPTRIKPAIEKRIEHMRRSRRLLGWQIAAILSMARSTIIKILKRVNLARLRDIDPPRTFLRYEYARPGELVHIDIKKLGRFDQVGHRIHGDRTRRSRALGYDHVFVAVDDASRRAETRIYDAERAENAADFLRRVLQTYKRRGITVERVMTDNGKVFTSNAFQAVLVEFGARHILTPPFTPEWNGKAERFIQTMLREWAYGVAYRDSQERAAALLAWLKYYNEERQHTSINYLAPARRWRQLCQ
jgi:transposase InsO family protein